MSRIALMSVPLHGHVNPLLGLSAELVRRGHDVTFATGTDLDEAVRATGARPVLYPSTLRSGRSGRGRWMPADDDGRRAVQVFAAERDAAVEPLATAYADEPPEVVVFDSVTASAPVLAERWRVPAIPFHPTHVLPDGHRTHGGPTPGAGGTALVGLPRSLQFRADEVPPDHVYVGPLDWRREQGAAPGLPVGRHVLVSLGTTFNDDLDLLRLAADAVVGLGGDWHVTVALGRPITRDAASGWPERVSVQPWVPQQAVLDAAALFVTAGGTGSVLEAIRARTPMVVLPQAVDQFMNAHQVAALGLGVAVRADRVDRATLDGAVRRALDLPGFGNAVDRLVAEIDAAGGATRAADVVEERLARASARAADGSMR